MGWGGNTHNMLSKGILFKYKEKCIFKERKGEKYNRYQSKKSGGTLFKSYKELKGNFIRINLSIAQEDIVCEAKI